MERLRFRRTFVEIIKWFFNWTAGISMKRDHSVVSASSVRRAKCACTDPAARAPSGASPRQTVDVRSRWGRDAFFHPCSCCADSPLCIAFVCAVHEWQVKETSRRHFQVEKKRDALFVKEGRLACNGSRSDSSLRPHILLTGQSLARHFSYWSPFYRLGSAPIRDASIYETQRVEVN